jgi:hypothetical protein
LTVFVSVTTLLGSADPAVIITATSLLLAAQHVPEDSIWHQTRRIAAWSEVTAADNSARECCITAAAQH